MINDLQESPAPLRLRNARLPGESEPVDVMITDGLISDRGGRTGTVEEVDLAGRFLTRGLWDFHVHFEQWSLARRRLDLTGTGSAADVLAVVAERLAADPEADHDQVLVGYGFRDGTWPDRPTRADLDRVSGDRPVALISNDLHSGWLNSAAFRRFGAVPSEDGVLRENAMAAVARELRQVPEPLLDRWVAEAAEAAAARGVVGIVDLERRFTPEHWARRVAAGTTALRVDCGIYPPEFSEAVRRGLRTGDPVPGGAGLLTVGPFKIIADGSLNTRTAFCHDPYPEPGDPEHDHGILLRDRDELVAMIKEAAAAGLASTVHAIGDEANTIALDAFQAAGIAGRIEHAQLLHAADAERFARLGVVASVQPDHAVTDRDVADRHWAGRTGRAFPYAMLLNAGATLILGSDAPVSPLDPWQTIAAAVHRSADERPAWHPEQEIGLAAALDASTGGRARPQPGDVADLVITDVDPLAATPEQLRSMPVSGTLLGGRWTYRKL